MLTSPVPHYIERNMVWKITWFVLVVSMVTITVTDACFIRNCPLGGKRSYSGRSQWNAKRQCMQCGPQGLGQCLGPNICCGPQIGCYISTSETKACMKENENPLPCDVRADVCGPHSDGRCASRGVCCTDEKCVLDAVCDDISPRDYTRSYDVIKDGADSHKSHFLTKQLDISPSLEKYIQRLLSIRESRND